MLLFITCLYIKGDFMDYKMAEYKIVKLLAEYFSCEFEVVDRHPNRLSFSSKEYDFSFPLTLLEESEPNLIKKVTSWLNETIADIKPNSYICYDRSGSFLPDTIIPSE